MSKTVMSRFLLMLGLLINFSIYAQKVDLNFNNDKFKIVQFTDVHYMPDKEDSKESLEMMNNVLNQEKPNLVVFTGDIVTGKPVFQGWDEVLSVVEQNNIPYIVTFGNHDSESEYSNEQIAEYVYKKNNCVNQSGSYDTFKCGNGVIAVKDDSGKNINALVYYINSNGYSKYKAFEGYGWIEKDQIDWYENTSKKLTASNGGIPYPALAFFHIPLPEHNQALGADKTNYIGSRREKECSPSLNSGWFLSMLECKDIMGVCGGNDHNNEYI